MRIDKTNNNSYISPSFKAEIRIVNDAVFDRELAKLKKSFQVGRISNKEWLIDEAAVKKPSAYTIEAYNCVVGSIINPETKKVNMFHLSPYEGNMSQLETVLDKLFVQVKKLKDDTKSSLQGFISGGSGRLVGDRNDRRLLQSILDLLKKMSDEIGLDYSVIAGRTWNEAGVNLLCDGEKNIHYLNPFYPSVPIKSIYDLAENYEVFSKSSVDKIVIENVIK